MDYSIENLIKKSMDALNVTTLTELATELATTQSTVSGWIKRKAIGTFLEKIIKYKPEILPYLFSDSKNYNDFRNSQNETAQDFSSNKTIQKNAPEDCLKFLKVDSSIATLFLDVYFKLEKENKLKKLFDLLGELKWK